MIAATSASRPARTFVLRNIVRPPPWPSQTTDSLCDGDDPPHGRGVYGAVILERPGLAEDPAEGLSLAQHAGIPQAGVRGGRVGALPDDPPNLRAGRDGEALRAEGEVDHPHPLHDHEAGQGPAPADGPLVGADDVGRHPDEKDDHPGDGYSDGCFHGMDPPAGERRWYPVVARNRQSVVAPNGYFGPFHRPSGVPKPSGRRLTWRSRHRSGGGPTTTRRRPTTSRRHSPRARPQAPA